MTIVDLFRGSALNTIDAKGRITLPAEFRATIGSRYRRSVHETGFDPALGDPDSGVRGRAAILVKDIERPCLLGYDNVYAAALLAQIYERHADKKGQEHERAVRRDQRFFGASEDVAWDLKGRIVLTQRMRARGGIEGLVYFFARGNMFELWNPVAFDHAHRQEEPEQSEDCRVDYEAHETKWSSRQPSG